MTALPYSARQDFIAAALSGLLARGDHPDGVDVRAYVIEKAIEIGDALWAECERRADDRKPSELPEEVAAISSAAEPKTLAKAEDGSGR